MKKKYLIPCIVLSYNLAIAQQATRTINNANNTAIQAITTATGDFGFVAFKPTANINPVTVFQAYAGAFGLGANDAMLATTTVTDQIGVAHHRYQQEYKTLPVEGGEYIVHAKNGVANTANGNLVEGLNFSATPTISQAQAILAATNHINAPHYMWETDTSYYPKPTLVIVCTAPQFELNATSFCLAYKLHIATDSLIEQCWVYVNASTGAFIKKESSVFLCETGTCQTSYYGTRNFNTQFIQRSLLADIFVLTDECRGNGITTLIGNDRVKDIDNNWSQPDERPATTTHWAMQQTFDYYLNTYNLASFNGANAEIICHAKKLVGTNPFNAAYSSNNNNDPVDDTFNFGPANGNDGHNSLDIVGHEFTHGVIFYKSHLSNVREAGALGESFGDIIGEMVEYITLGTNDYIHGQEVNGGNRNLMNPKAFNHPNTYNGTNWLNSNCSNPDRSNDFCGTHTNCGVQNYWFYLLAEGGSGTNDIGNSYCVKGIGKTKAAQITFKNLAFYLTSTANYASARAGAILAATDLFGANSNEVAQTIAAWYAVGVGANYSGTIALTNKTIISTEQYNYANKVSVNNVTVNGGNLVVTSAKEVGLTGNIAILPGSKASFYIIPACTGSARLMHPASNNNTTTEYQDTPAPAQSAKMLPANTYEQLAIYPNPTNGTLTINNPNWEVYTYTLQSIHSALLKQGLVTNNQLSIAEYPTGLYLLQLNNANGVSTTFKVIKE